MTSFTRLERGSTYRTVEHVLTLVSALFDVPFQRGGVERLQELETTKQLSRNRHDRTPVIKLAAVLSIMLVFCLSYYAQIETHVWCRKHRDQDPISEEFISVLNDHMRSTDQIKVMLL